MIVLLALLLAGADALALPGPVLGPDGVLHLGPLPPEVEDPRGVAVVDPLDGSLYLELPGAAGAFSWDGVGWTVDGSAVLATDPRDDSGPVPPTRGATISGSGLRWRVDDGVLAAVLDPEGGWVQVASDDQGRPRRLTWADGSRLSIRYDGFGRVAAFEGPGSRMQTLTWRDGSLTSMDLRGTPMVVRSIPGVRTADRGIEVTDGLGRTTRTWFATDERGVEHVVGWDDPRGLQSLVVRSDRGLELRDGGGRTWRVEQDDAGQTVAVDLPGGRRWTWRRNRDGRISAVIDPVGRVHAWAQDRAGRVETFGQGSSTWRLRRDAAGRVDQVVDPLGAVTTLQRDPAGRVQRVVDALGNETRIERSVSGQVIRIDGPTGVAWRLERDLLGRVRRIADPADGRVDLDRDDGGLLVGIRDLLAGSFRLDRAPDGRLERVRAPTGDSVDLVRDGLGRVRAVRRADGSEITLVRDALGEVVRVGQGGEEVVVERDLHGWPQRAGGVGWRRDGEGRVVALETAGRRVDLALDAGGGISSVRAGEWSVSLERDGAGRVIRWRGADGEVEVRRDPAGRITWERVDLGSAAAPSVGPAPAGASGGATGLSDEELLRRWSEGRSADPKDLDHHLGTWADEQGLTGAATPAPAAAGAGPGEVRAAWDPAGRLARVELDGDEWRLMRDAAGRVLRLVSDRLGTLGMDWDGAGRATLVRYPKGALVRLAWSTPDVLLSFVGSDGRQRDAWRRTSDALGRRTRDEVGSQGSRTWRRDPVGRLVVVEDGVGGAWSWSPELRSGPDGSEVYFDEGGRPSQARPPIGPAAWGVGSTTVSYAWGPSGALLGVAGEVGAAELGYDERGRLAELQPELDAPWRLRYDARGRLAAVQRGDEALHLLAWGPADGSGRAPLLGSGPGAVDRWLWSAWGPGAVQAGARLLQVIVDPEGSPWWVVGPEGPPAPAGSDLLGYPMLTRGQVSADLPAVGGRVQLFPGGPLLDLSPAEGGAVPAGVALDPLSGRRIDGLRPWPWSVPSLLEDQDEILDPAGWAPTGPWADPLRLLVELGEVEEPLVRTERRVEREFPVLAGLPRGLERRDPPLGPPLLGLPLDEDPLTLAVVASALPGGAPLDADFVLRVLLAEELGLPWLPPGLGLPLPAAWIEDPATRDLPVAQN